MCALTLTNRPPKRRVMSSPSTYWALRRCISSTIERRTASIFPSADYARPGRSGLDAARSAIRSRASAISLMPATRSKWMSALRAHQWEFGHKSEKQNNPRDREVLAVHFFSACLTLSRYLISSPDRPQVVPRSVACPSGLISVTANTNSSPSPKTAISGRWPT